MHLENAVITPEKCEAENSPVDRACTFKCKNGFTLQGGKSTTKCTDRGMWDSYGQYCKGIELRFIIKIKMAVNSGISKTIFQQ